MEGPVGSHRTGSFRMSSLRGCEDRKSLKKVRERLFTCHADTTLLFPNAGAKVLGEAQLSDSSLKQARGSLACRIRGELRFGLGAAFVKPHSSYDLDTLSAGTLSPIRLFRPPIEYGSTQERHGFWTY